MAETVLPVEFPVIGVIGAGTMGHGIAHVAAAAGSEVLLFDRTMELAAKGLSKIKSNLDKGVEKGKVSAADRDGALARLRACDRLEELAGAALLIEAVPEDLQMKRDLFVALEGIAPGAVMATNTSSLSLKAIAAPLQRPERLIGTHFFNPVHIMSLLEIVVHDGTAPEVLEQIRAWGGRIGKECIVVRDFPGFATSRLGVALGMEAIRMVEQGVASAEDIDKAMVLGYRHPVGPLRLTDMVGLDVRMKIGLYLSEQLSNPAFQPPALMRQMVADGKLGQKTGQGFYKW